MSAQPQSIHKESSIFVMSMHKHMKERVRKHPQTTRMGRTYTIWPDSGLKWTCFGSSPSCIIKNTIHIKKWVEISSAICEELSGLVLRHVGFKFSACLCPRRNEVSMMMGNSQLKRTMSHIHHISNFETVSGFEGPGRRPRSAGISCIRPFFVPVQGRDHQRLGSTWHFRHSNLAGSWHAF